MPNVGVSGQIAVICFLAKHSKQEITERDWDVAETTGHTGAIFVIGCEQRPGS